MRFTLPSPYEEVSHTADVGIRARGVDPAEAYARAALAMAQLQAGGGAIGADVELPIEANGESPGALLVDLCRQVLDHFHRGRLLLAAIEIDELTEDRIRARGWFGRFDPERHAEGADIKAVTYALADVKPVEGGFEATLVFDI